MHFKLLKRRNSQVGTGVLCTEGRPNHNRTKRGEGIFEYPTGTHYELLCRPTSMYVGQKHEVINAQECSQSRFFCKKMTTSYKYVFQDFPIFTCMYCIPMFYGLCRSRPSRQNQSIIESTEIIIFNASRQYFSFTIAVFFKLRQLFELIF